MTMMIGSTEIFKQKGRSPFVYKDYMEDYFVVYLHKDINGVPFYAGHGRLKRAFLKENRKSATNCTKRGIAYSEKVKSLNYDYAVEIVAEFDSKEQAIRLEQLLYDKYKDTLVNRARPASPVLMDNIDFSKFVCYDLNSPTYLRWVIQPSRKIKIGNPAGCLKDDGYYITKIDGHGYLNHRIIAVLFGMKVDGMLVDHIDRRRHNNNVENLRVIDALENSKNRSNNKRQHSVSGTTGVSLSVVKYKDKEYIGWVAEWREHGKHKTKYFSCSGKNSDEVLLEAKKYREMKEIELGYYTGHGEKTPDEKPRKLTLCFEQIDKITNEIINTYESISDLIDRNPSFKPGPIYAVCNGKKKSYKGYFWRSFKHNT